jgi:hypothetical protein
MKTYEIYGASPEVDSAGGSRATSTTEVALLVQEALHVDMLARAQHPAPLRQYRHAELDDNCLREEFVLPNVSYRDDSLPYPEFDHPVIVRINEPADPQGSHDALHDVGLVLLRSRRREYTTRKPVRGEPMLEMYGAAGDAARAVELLSPVLSMAFDGNVHASSGGDSHYYDESDRFGTILVFNNAARPFDDVPFPKHTEFPTIVIAVNPPHCGELGQLLTAQGFTSLTTAKLAGLS